eukprot:gnl/TRDRNA2_/TRDRNA2_193170_c0_seq1.p1 gnl/TRDRNA2_/TRDRNA2_193170_c0~~gnl/TRDRNA2_/TRDRNA2_193170_c0_seq1.p1  ORF type:complete len:367 (+),score=61.54 gnl/TRDRNA2_/TRDRNA2_193170_c0_seq1:72-1103(+)
MSTRRILETHLPSWDEQISSESDRVRNSTGAVSDSFRQRDCTLKGSSDAPHLTNTAMIYDMAGSDSSDCEDDGGSSGFESCYESFPEDEDWCEDVERFNLDSGSEAEDNLDISRNLEMYNSRPFLRVNSKKMQSTEAIVSPPNSPSSSKGGSPRHLRKPLGRTATAGCGDGFAASGYSLRHCFDDDPEPEPGPSSPASPQVPQRDHVYTTCSLSYKVQHTQPCRGRKIHLGPKPKTERRSESPEEDVDTGVLDIWKLEGQNVNEELEVAHHMISAGGLTKSRSAVLPDDACAWAATNLVMEPIYQDALERTRPHPDLNLDRFVLKLRNGVQKYDCTGLLIDCF